MRKLRTIVIYVILSAVILGFVVQKTAKTSQQISMVAESAIQYAQDVYNDMYFDMLSWNYNRHNQTYTVTLSNSNNSIVQLYCVVDPTIKNGKYYPVEIYGGKNIDVNKARACN